MDLFAFIDSFGFRVALVVVTLSSFGIYVGLGHDDERGEVLMGWPEALIPFVPAFVVPYLLYIPLLLGLVFYGILVSPHFAEIAASVLAMQIAAAAVFSLHETRVKRPRVSKRDESLYVRLTHFIYHHDKPNNAYPSLHVAYAVLCGYWLSVLFPPFAPLIVTLAFLIALSTVFIKQHAVIDVVGGAAMGLLWVALVHL
jgi:membrane-associated phospholipid phosphatase